MLDEIIEEHKKEGLRETLDNKKCNLRWVSMDFEDDRILNFLKEKGKVVNRYPGIRGLAHKDVTAKIMRIAEELKSGSADFIPASFVIPQDLALLERLDKKKAN